MFVDYHVHAIGHKDREHNLENLREYLSFAKKRGVAEIGFADHDRYLKYLDFNLYEQLQEEFPDIKINVGLEIDYYPDKMEKVLEKRNSYDYDYVIGSVHYLGGWMFDNIKLKERYAEWDIDELYEKYLETVVDSAKTGLFPMIGHMDLIKIFKHRPKADTETVFRKHLRELKKTDVVIELNTNGWYKPVKELYPSPQVIEMCFEEDIPITLSSDAHHPEQVGRDLEKACRIAKKIGYNKIAGFSKGKRHFLSI